MIGERLGAWVIDSELGRGGMAHVYLAHEETAEGQGRQAAVKVLPAPLAQDPGFLTRFQREIDVLRQLDHPHIVRLFDAGVPEGRFFYAMEYVPGPNFDALLKEQGRLPWPEVLGLAMQISLALKHAHDRGIIHRDIKPSNLLRASTDLVKLSDFGIAKVFASTHLTVAGGVIGTPEYLSPEQATGKQATPRSDLYSLGVVLYTLLTGKPPFEGESVVDLLHKHRYAQVEKPSRLATGLPHDFEAVVCQLLEKDPSKRPADGMVLYKQLDRLRGKYQRKAKETMAGLPPPPIDSPLVDSRPPGEEAAFQGPGPATLMAELMREELEKEKSGGPVNRALNRWWVLVPLLALSIGLIVWNFWPPSAASLFQRGSALMQSDNPDDWERGWTEFLARLERDHEVHPYKEEVEGYRKQYEDHVALKEAERAAREAERTARKAGLRVEASEAQWFYLEGLRLRRQGNKADAERVWRDTIAAFRDVESEKPWVVLAERELKRSADSQAPDDTRWAGVRNALNKARHLRDTNQRAEAEAIWNSLEGLYKDDSSAAPILDEVRKDRSQ